MDDHTNFHKMPAMTRRAFLAGLMAVPAAACVPGLGSVEPQTHVFTQRDFMDLLREAQHTVIENGVGNPGPCIVRVGGVIFNERDLA